SYCPPGMRISVMKLACVAKKPMTEPHADTTAMLPGSRGNTRSTTFSNTSWGNGPRCITFRKEAHCHLNWELSRGRLIAQWSRLPEATLIAHTTSERPLHQSWRHHYSSAAAAILLRVRFPVRSRHCFGRSDGVKDLRAILTLGSACFSFYRGR